MKSYVYKDPTHQTQPIIDVDCRCQTAVQHEKVAREYVDGTVLVGSRKVYTWHSYGFYMGRLTEAYFAGRAFIRWTLEEQAYVVPMELEDNADLKDIMRWVRDMTRTSKGRWSVAAVGRSEDGTGGFPPRPFNILPLNFSFEKKEDAVKFKVFAVTQKSS